MIQAVEISTLLDDLSCSLACFFVAASYAPSSAVGGVYVKDVQNNPLQPDINYCGFTASPLLGTINILGIPALLPAVQA